MADLKMRSINNGFEKYRGDTGPMNETRILYFHLTHAEMVAMPITRNGDVCYVESNDSLHLRHADGTWKHIAIQENLWTVVHKTADESVTSSTTLHNDATLQIPLLASTKYAIRGEIFFNTTAAADFKWRHAGPASPTLVQVRRSWIIPGGAAYEGVAVDTAFSTADLFIKSTAAPGYISFTGIIHNGVNAGTFVIQWAQNTADPGATTVRAGSYLEWRAL